MLIDAQATPDLKLDFSAAARPTVGASELYRDLVTCREANMSAQPLYSDSAIVLQVVWGRPEYSERKLRAGLFEAH